MHRLLSLLGVLALAAVAAPSATGVVDASPPPDSGLVARYPLDEGTAEDVSGNGLHGVVHGATATTDRFGRADRALSFDGTSAFIDLGTDAALNFPSWDDYSVSVWFLNDGAGTSDTQKLVDKTVVYHDWWLGAVPPGNPYHSGLRVQTYESGSAPIIGPDEVRDNQWHHVVISRTGGVGTMWFDGTPVASAPTKTVFSNGKLLVGYSDSPDANQRRYWSGKVDELVIYDRVLTETEIAALADPDCAERILFIAGASPAPPGDSSLLTILEDRSPGAECVTVLPPANVTPELAELFHVAVISSSVTPSDVGGLLKDADVPVLLSEANLFDDMGFVVNAKNAKELAGRTTISIVDPAHPLAAGYTGTVKVYDTPAAVGYALDGAAPDIEDVAHTAASSRRMTLFAFDEDARLADGTRATERRVGFFGSYGATYSPAGADLVHASIDWLTRGGDGPMAPPTVTDGDAVDDTTDLCPFVPAEAVQFDPLQLDADHDGIGDACDPTPTAPALGVFTPGDRIVWSGSDWSADWSTAADFDGVHGPDVVMVQGYGNMSGYYTRLNVLLNDGTGSFGLSQTLVADYYRAVVVGDFDGGGDLDILADRLYDNDGTGTFSAGDPVAMPRGPKVADVDGDGDLDVVGVDKILVNDGSGAFSTTTAPWSPSSWSVTVGDLDVDGDLDVFVLDDADSESDSLWLNDGMGVFSRAADAPTDDWSSNAAVFADLDGDRDLDIVLEVWGGDRRIDVFRNDGAGNFTPWQEITGSEANYRSLTTADVDGDGDLDLVAAGYDGRLWHNDGSGVLVEVPHAPAPRTAVDAVDVDGDGVVELIGERVWWNTGRGRTAFVAGSTKPPPNDAALIARIREFGSEVVIVDDDAAAGFDFESVDAVFVSSSVIPSKIGGLLADVPIPVAIWEPHLFDDMGLTTSQGEVAGRAVVVVDGVRDVNPLIPAHPLAAELVNGRQRVYTTSAPISYGTPTPSADVVAHIPGRPERATIFQYDFRDARTDGTPAPALRIGFLASYQGAKVLSDTGWRLFDVMVDRTLTGRTWPPGNDAFDQAWPLTVPTDMGNNCGASTNGYEWIDDNWVEEPYPSAADYGEFGALDWQRSVWWHWTAPASGSVTFDIGRSFAEGGWLGARIAVWTGDEFSSLTEVASGPAWNDEDPFVTIDAIAGTTYRVAVYGYDGACGDIVIDTTFA